MTFKTDMDLLAPSVEARWRDGFVLELRLVGARGALITDALAEVETHCRESGHSAADAFGPPVAYARALDLPDESGLTPTQALSTGAVCLLLAGGAGAVILGATSLAQAQRVGIDAGTVASAVVIVVLMTLTFALGDRLLRLIMDHPVWFSASFAGAVLLTLLAGLPLRDVALGSVAAGPTLAAGLAAIAACPLIALVERRSGHGLADPLIPPSGRRRRVRRPARDAD